MLSIALALSLVPDRGPIDFASMPWANRPDGRRVYRVVLDSLPGEEFGCQIFDCKSADGVFRSIRFRAGVADMSERTVVFVVARADLGTFDGRLLVVQLLDAVPVGEAK